MTLADEVDEVIQQVKGRIATMEMALEGLKREVERIEGMKRRWNPCQQELRDKDINWP